MFTRLASFLLCGLCFAMVVLDGRAALGQFEELVRRVPANANALVLVDADKVFASPAAARDNWRENRQRAWESGLSLLPPTAKHAILASQLDLKSMINVWETAVMRLDHEPALDKLAKLSGGALDKVNGYSAVAMSSDSYVVDFRNRIVGAIAPGNRQLVGRWIQETESRKTDGLSPYLKEAFGFANDLGTPVVMALDLEYAITADDARVALSDLPDSIGVSGINLDQLSELMASIRGVTLGITLRDKPFGKVKVDFSKDFPLPASVAKGLFLHALAKRGAMIDEFEDWTPAVSGKHFTMEGNLEQSGIRRLSSLFDRPPAIPHPEMQLKSPGQSPGDQQTPKELTLKYWNDMTKLLSDLSERRKSPGTKTMGQVGVFCERYAAKIEKLPTLNVDPELLDFSAHLCSTLRQIHSRIHSGAVQGSTAARAVTPTYNYYGYGETYGYTYGWPVGSYGTVAVPDMRAYYNEQSRVKYEANSKATFDVRQIGQQIRASIADMRRKLTDKYQTQF